MTTAWTSEKVRRAQDMLAAGQTQQQVAAAFGCTPSNISKRLRHTSTDGAKVYAMRQEGRGFVEIAEALGMPPSPGSVRRVYMRLVRYCEREGLEYPQVRRVSRPKAPRPQDEMPLFRVSFFVRRRAGRGQASTIADVANALRISERDAKLYAAELRRRGVFANGIVPTRTGIEQTLRAELVTTCREAVLFAVTEAWTSGAPCETLRSLREKLSYSHSTVNVSIVQLRDAGLVAPRGFLYPRGRHE